MFSSSFANNENVFVLFDDSFKSIALTLILSNTPLGPLFILYKRIVSDSIRLRDMSTFCIQQLGKFSEQETETSDSVVNILKNETLLIVGRTNINHRR
jgi:hypothetical protein